MNGATVVVAGIGGALPDRRVSNEELESTIDTTDEWIRGRTGIGARYWSDGVSTSDLAVAAGARALTSAGAESADLVIVATTTPDFRCPATAPSVAARLGFDSVPGFDISAVCSGFIFGLATAKAYIASGAAHSVLVIGAETYSTILDPSDRSTSVIFGDGAGAMLLRGGKSTDCGSIHDVDLGSNGFDAGLICVPGGGAYEATHPSADQTPYLTMKGREVFRRAVTHMAQSSQAALASAGWSADQLDWVVGHQANQRILHGIADQLEVDRARLILNLQEVGNTSAASIPLALIHGVTSGDIMAKDKLLLTAFGGGTTWGSVALSWPAIDVEAPILISADYVTGELNVL